MCFCVWYDRSGVLWADGTVDGPGLFYLKLPGVTTSCLGESRMKLCHFFCFALPTVPHLHVQYPFFFLFLCWSSHSGPYTYRQVLYHRAILPVSTSPSHGWTRAWKNLLQGRVTSVCCSLSLFFLFKQLCVCACVWTQECLPMPWHSCRGQRTALHAFWYQTQVSELAGGAPFLKSHLTGPCSIWDWLSSYMDQADVKLVTLLPQTSSCWNYRCCHPSWISAVPPSAVCCGPMSVLSLQTSCYVAWHCVQSLFL